MDLAVDGEEGGGYGGCDGVAFVGRAVQVESAGGGEGEGVDS